jgi:hypothetical protein
MEIHKNPTNDLDAHRPRSSTLGFLPSLPRQGQSEITNQSLNTVQHIAKCTENTASGFKETS